jgi:RNA polymerase sigma-70 factor (ECF subfamily)
MRRQDPFADPAPLIKRVYSYVAYRLGDGPAAEDVTSDVFERAIRYRHTYDETRGKPLPWLLGIARRCVNEELANRRPASNVDDHEQESDEDLAVESVRRLTLATELARLDEHSRDLIALRYGADLTARQIGEIVGSKTNTVEVALHRALARLRRALNAEPGADSPPTPQVAPPRSAE